jgi:hypothetical protein
MVEALIRLKGADASGRKRLCLSQKSCDSCCRSLVRETLEVMLLMSNRMSGVTLRRPLIVIPQWKISLSNILALQL